MNARASLFSGSPDSPAQKGSSAMRDRSVDLQRGILVVLMLYAHLLQFFGDLQRFPSIHFWVMGISLLAFPAFVFCFGRTAALAYLKKPFRQALPRMGRTFGRCLAAFYVSGAAFRVLREHRPLEAETLRGILLLSDIPGWSEFLIAFALLMLSAILLFPLLRQLARRRWLWLPLSLPCALCCFLPYDRVTLPQLALLIGGKNLVTYPIVQYFPFFLAGMAYADASFRERLGMGGAALAFSAAGLVRYVRHGLPERFPPHWAWIVLPCFAIALLTALCHGLCRLPGEKYWLPVEWLRRALCRLGGASLYYLVGSNLALFTLAGAGIAPLPGNLWPWNQPLPSPAGALSWLVVLLALLWFIARLAGRGASGKAPGNRISN